MFDHVQPLTAASLKQGETRSSKQSSSHTSAFKRLGVMTFSKSKIKSTIVPRASAFSRLGGPTDKIDGKDFKETTEMEARPKENSVSDEAKDQDRGRLARWLILFNEFEIVYIPRTAIKGQALANFLANHPIPIDWEISEDFLDEEVFFVETFQPWMIFFDGATRSDGMGAKIDMSSEEIELSSASSISNNSSRPGLSKSKGKAIIMSEPVGEAAIGEVEVNTMFKRRERNKTSQVWDFFVDVTLANRTKKVKCKLCNAILNKTKGGTTTQLLRHQDTYCPKYGIAATNQSVINVELGKMEYEVSKKDFKYNHAKVREAAAQMILVHEYPFNMMEHEFFNRFMRTATPYYERVDLCRQIQAPQLLWKELVEVASEAAFSTGGRVIDPYRASLSTKTVEALICGGDWIRSLYGVKEVYTDKIKEEIVTFVVIAWEIPV
ncbi:hypothetical protein RJ640_008982 [Escallonia rubra]|uniref:BED-type domain-containing protein n=1 Tax=Escallonia rubra TaxID=112253 RepID=A0AA88RGN7_9ASTE|nr:hypothetical protein RJ640_008982 [Escallonia rubra]